MNFWNWGPTTISHYCMSVTFNFSKSLHPNIYIYILKKERNVLRSFTKERNILTFFYVLCKRTLRSLRSFMFFAKERCILCALFRSLEKNGKEQNILSGLISRQKLEKRTEKNGTFFKRMGKNGTF